MAVGDGQVESRPTFSNVGNIVWANLTNLNLTATALFIGTEPGGTGGGPRG